MAGQTLSDIRALLAAAGLAPLHRFGQNFLVDLNLMRKLLAAAELSPGDVVLEVGPGTGSLTELLIETGARVIAVEIDRGLQRLIAQRILGIEAEEFERHGDEGVLTAPGGRVTLICGDALAGKRSVNPRIRETLLAAPPAGGGYKLVANLPYQIATPLLMELLYGDPPFQRLVCTIQKEVGERLSAPPRSSAYGPVSVIAQTLAKVETIALLPAAAFWPRPQVHSVMLRIDPIAREALPVEDPKGMAEFVRNCFQQRRKKLAATLRGRVSNPQDLLHQLQAAPAARPEELPPRAWQLLWQAVRQESS